MKADISNIGISAIPVIEEAKTIEDSSIQNLKFNVMHNKNVEERLIFKKYIIESNRVETYFDREYKTSMKKSPDHYIFLSSLINLQKMIYLLMCDRFKIPYNKNDEEKVKIWPTSVDVRMNGIVRKKKNIMQDFELTSISQISDGKYHISGKSSAESAILLKGEALVYII
tara:strand:- start:22 stop:531 length:510 start_codon:yes stop_codon:yes gene_type:complete